MVSGLTPKQKDFMQEADRQFRDLGFTIDGPQQLSRQTELGKQYIHFSFSETVLDMRVIVNIGITCYVVEDLLAELEGSIRVGTLGGDFGYAIHHPFWTIPSNDLPANTCAEIKKAFKNLGLPLLNRIATLQDVFLALSSRQDTLSEQLLSNPTELGRAKRAVVASFLLDHDLFDATQQAEVQKLPHPGAREDLISLIKKLNERKSTKYSG